MSNLNCRWATAEEMARIVEGGLVPAVLVPKRVAPKSAAANGAAVDGAAANGAAPDGEALLDAPVAAAATEVVAESEIEPEAELQFSWAAMISPPRLALLGTEKVFALMGPRESEEGEARQVDISQPANIPVQLGTPSKWRWQRSGGDIVLLGSGVVPWAKLRESTLTHQSGPVPLR